MKKATTDWAWLPKELLDLILDNLIQLKDYIRFSTVCKSWFSVAVEQKTRRIKSSQLLHPPLLLIPNNDCTVETRSLYNFMDQKILNTRLNVPHAGRRLAGSSHGCLIAVQDDMTVILINPFTGNTVNLPSLCPVPICFSVEYPVGDIARDMYVSKVILSSDPFLYPEEDYVVAAIFSSCHMLAIFRSSNQTWTYASRRFRLIHDLQFYDGHLYALDSYHSLIRVHYNDDDHYGDDKYKCQPHTREVYPWYRIFYPTRDNGLEYEDDSDNDSDDDDDDDDKDDIIPWNYFIPDFGGPFLGMVILPTNCGHKAYIVESTKKELLMVDRFFLKESKIEKDITVKFKVYQMMIKLDKQEKGIEEGEWVEIESLGEDALFLGSNHSMCVSASQFSNCRPNCIYYTDDYNRHHEPGFVGYCDMGIFYLHTQRIEPHYKLLLPSQEHMPPSIWVVPTPHI